MPGILQDARDGLAAGPDEALAADGAPEAEQPIEEFVVVNQEVLIEVNFREQSVQGESRLTIYLTNPDDPPDEVALDARQCEIDTRRIRVNGKAVRATYRDPYEALDVPPSWYLAPANFPVLKNRMRGLLPRRRRDLPVEKREQVGCTPADRSLRVALHPERPPASSPSTAPGKLRVRLSTTGLQEAEPAKAHVPEQPTNGLFEIVVPFRTTHIRDGFQFVGVNDNDARFPHVYTRHAAEPGFAACLFPCIDDPGARCFWKIHIKCPRTLGDALMQELASHQSSGGASHPYDASNNGQRQLQLTEEDKLLDMTAVCSGNLVGERVDETDETKKVMTFEITDHNAAAQHIGFAVGPFEHVDLFSEFRSEEADERLGASALKIHGYCLPGRQEEVRNTCAAMAYAADEFAMSYGRYPYDSYKLCFVDDMVGETTPLLSMSLCSNRLLFPAGLEDRDIEVTRKLVHSLAYQYFGAYIVPNQRTELWLTVGIAYYMTDLFLSKLCGSNDYRFRIKTMADRLAEEDRGRPSLHELGTYTFLGSFEMDFLVLKAPLVLFILDKRLTKAAGSASASLARVISKIIGKANTSGWDDNNAEIISSETFRRVCEKTSQYPLEAFWNQWVLGAGCPWLTIKQRFNRKRLCVEISILQTQETAAVRRQAMQHDDFWRALIEAKYGTYSRKVQRLFTGPMTIRIHEANGTPYEHIVEIREDAAFTGGAKFDIPYNTKYKRLKRNRRHRERAAAAAAAADATGENNDELIVFSLGDRLDSPEDMQRWELIDWTEQDEKNMDQESYEWIRIDSDFEWLVKMHTNMPSWMYLSQLQQDRDVAAQQDTLLYLTRIREHAMAATILTRTLYDERYFHGLRTMAAQVLSRQAWKADADGESSGDGGAAAGAGAGTDGGIVFRGMRQLMQVFRERFCYPDQTSRPNDFSDHQRYLVQCAMVEAIASAQFDDRHPREAQRFLLDLLRFNDNSQNGFSDHVYVAKLLVALATSFCSKEGAAGGVQAKPSKTGDRSMDMVLTFDDAMSDAGSDLGLGGLGGKGNERAAEDVEGQQLLAEALAEIERYRRMDEWTGSYQNLWTTAALEGKRLLMQAGVIPMDALEFVRYLQDGTVDVVQVKAFEALVSLGLMLRPAILRLLLAAMTLHSSPFVRDQLFGVFCRGLAAIAFGEVVTDEEKAALAARERSGKKDKADKGQDGNGDASDSESDGGLIIEQGDAIIRQHQEQHARRETIGAAVRALKTAVSTNRALLAALWDAMLSPATGCVEKRNLLELLETLFDGETALLLTVRHPTMWKAVRRTPTSCILDFQRVPRPLRPKVVPIAVPVPLAAGVPAVAGAPVVAGAPAVAVSAPSVASAPAVTSGAVSKPASAATPAAVTPAASAAVLPPLFPSPAGLGAPVPVTPAAAASALARTRLPDEPRKMAAPKIRLQTGRSSLSNVSGTPTSASSTLTVVRKPSGSMHPPASSLGVPSALAVAPASTPTPAVADSIAVQRRSTGSSASPDTVKGSPAAAIPAAAAAAAATTGPTALPSTKNRTPLTSGKRKREVDDDGPPTALGALGGPGGSSGGRRRKMVRIAVPRNYSERLSPKAAQWLHTPRRSAAAEVSIRAAGVSRVGTPKAGTPKAGTPKAGTPARSDSPRIADRDRGRTSTPLSSGRRPTPPPGSHASVSKVAKPARKPLPTGGVRPTAASVSAAMGPTPAAAPGPAPVAVAVPAPSSAPAPSATPTPVHKPIFIKFKNKSAS